MTWTRRSPPVPIIAVLVLVVLAGPAAGPLAAQDQGDGQGRGTDTLEPEPYRPEEFPQWTRDLRRGEIIALGAFPVAMILSGLSYQVGRFTYHSIAAGSPQPEYAPGFLSPDSGPRYTGDERVGLIVSGAIISLGIAVADYLLGRRERTAEP